jgi:hypothetical protein
LDAVVWEISAWQARAKHTKQTKTTFLNRYVDGRVKKCPSLGMILWTRRYIRKRVKDLKGQRDTHVNLLSSKWVGIINLILLFLTRNVFWFVPKNKEKNKSLIHYNKRCPRT